MTAPMHRNMFGDPYPATLEQLIAAFAETAISPRLASVMINHDPDDAPPFTGWSAEFSDDVQIADDLDDDGEQWETRTFSTAGFPTKEALLEVLGAVGVRLNQVSTYE